MLTALVFWFIFALAVGFIADARGRSGFGWFFLAILISPLIACVLILALPTPRSKSALSQRGRRLCPFCAEPIRLEAKLCPHCRSEVTPEPQPSLRSDLDIARASPGKAIAFIAVVGGIFAIPALLTLLPERTASTPHEGLTPEQIDELRSGKPVLYEGKPPLPNYILDPTAKDCEKYVCPASTAIHEGQTPEQIDELRSGKPVLYEGKLPLPNYTLDPTAKDCEKYVCPAPDLRDAAREPPEVPTPKVVWKEKPKEKVELKSETRSMSYSACNQHILNMAQQLGAPVNIMEETGVSRIVRFRASDGSVLVTCSGRDRKMIVTQSPHRCGGDLNCP